LKIESIVTRDDIEINLNNKEGGDLGYAPLLLPIYNKTYIINKVENT
jgi:hypothetical protein